MYVPVVHANVICYVVMSMLVSNIFSNEFMTKIVQGNLLKFQLIYQHFNIWQNRNFLVGFSR